MGVDRSLDDGQRTRLTESDMYNAGDLVEGFLPRPLQRTYRYAMACYSLNHLGNPEFWGRRHEAARFHSSYRRHGGISIARRVRRAVRPYAPHRGAFRLRGG